MKLEPTDKTCKTCKETKSSTYFEVNRSECEACRQKLKYAKTKKVDNSEQNKPMPKECRLCKNTPELGAKFAWRIDTLTGNWRSGCMDCFNNHEYYKPYREKKMNEDAGAYREHTAEVHNEWTDKNPEYNKNQQEFIRTNKEKKTLFIMKDCRYKNVQFEFNDIDKMKTKLTEECFYCGYIGEILNGLDRVDPTKTYNDKNTVPCCVTCNSMKCKTHVDKFIQNIRNIVNHIGEKEICRDEIRKRLPPFSGRKELRDAPKKAKTDFLTREERYNIMNQPCYKCGIEKSNGVDRVDSSKDYTLENSMPCCEICNKMKKDLMTDDFEKHVYFVYKHTKYWVLSNISNISDMEDDNSGCSKKIVIKEDKYSAVAAMIGDYESIFVVFSNTDVAIDKLQLKNMSLSRGIIQKKAICGHFWKYITPDEYNNYMNNTSIVEINAAIKKLLLCKRIPKYIDGVKQPDEYFGTSGRVEEEKKKQCSKLQNDKIDMVIDDEKQPEKQPEKHQPNTDKIDTMIPAIINPKLIINTGSRKASIRCMATLSCLS